MGYLAWAAVASGIAFVSGIAVIAALKRPDLGRTDYTLGTIMIAGTPRRPTGAIR